MEVLSEVGTPRLNEEQEEKKEEKETANKVIENAEQKVELLQEEELGKSQGKESDGGKSDSGAGDSEPEGKVEEENQINLEVSQSNPLLSRDAKCHGHRNCLCKIF